MSLSSECFSQLTDRSRTEVIWKRAGNLWVAPETNYKLLCSLIGCSEGDIPPANKAAAPSRSWHVTAPWNLIPIIHGDSIVSALHKKFLSRRKEGIAKIHLVTDFYFIKNKNIFFLLHTLYSFGRLASHGVQEVTMEMQCTVLKKEKNIHQSFLPKRPEE